MAELDDMTLVRAPDADVTLVDAPPRSKGLPVTAIAVVGLALGAAGAWWWTQEGPATGPPAAAERPLTATEGLVAPASPQARPLPPLDQMDIFLRTLLGTLSASPELSRWLLTEDLIRQMANAIDRVSLGASPARELTVLKPRGALEVGGPRNATTIDPRSYRRFDGLAAAVLSLEPRAVADAYRTIQPRLDEAYRSLGRAQGGVDNALLAALQVLIDTPALPTPTLVVHGPGATYAYADPRFEALLPAQKQLLRMGPDNAARVQTRLREIRDAIASK